MIYSVVLTSLVLYAAKLLHARAVAFGHYIEVSSSKSYELLYAASLLKLASLLRYSLLSTAK